MSVNAGQHESADVKRNTPSRAPLRPDTSLQAHLGWAADQISNPANPHSAAAAAEASAAFAHGLAGDSASWAERVSTLNMILAAIGEVIGQHLEAESTAIAHQSSHRNDLCFHHSSPVMDLINDTQLNSTAYLRMSYEVLCQATILRLMRDNQTKNAVMQLLE